MIRFRQFIAIIITVLILNAFIFNVFAFSAQENRTSELSNDNLKQKLLNNPVFIYSEGSENILTDEASKSIKDGLKKIIDPYEGRKFVKEKLAEYFKDTYTESSIITSGDNSSIRSSIGDTRTLLSFEVSGLYDADDTAGLWYIIITAVLDLIFSFDTAVSWILTTVEAAVGITADTQELAQAKNMYNFRWAPMLGEVYYDDYYTGLGWYDHACSVTRQIFEHGWGYYFDQYSMAHQATVDNFFAKSTEYAPHFWNSSWMEAKAYNQWYYQLPYYYEDWND